VKQKKQKKKTEIKKKKKKGKEGKKKKTPNGTRSPATHLDSAGGAVPTGAGSPTPGGDLADHWRRYYGEILTAGRSSGTSKVRRRPRAEHAALLETVHPEASAEAIRPGLWMPHHGD